MQADKTFAASLLACAAIAATTAHAQSFVDGFLQNFSTGAEVWVGYQFGTDSSDSLAWNTSTGAVGEGGGYIDGGTTCGSACLGITALGSGNVTNGSLGVSVAATFPVSADSAITAVTYSQYADSLTITGGTGSGVLALIYSVDGSLSESSAGGTCEVFVSAACNGINAGLGGAPTGTTVSVSTGGSVYTDPVNGESLGEFPLVSGSQSDTVALHVPFTYGSPISIEPYMAAFTSISDSTAVPYSSNIDFSDTMTLDSAVVYAGTPQELGAENYSADIGSASGLLYGPSGVSPVPLPASAWLMLSGLGGFGALVWRRKAARAPEPAPGRWPGPVRS